jgi:site-specific DNA-cytosine methylase
MGTVVGTLADLGYGWAYRILDARYFGVPQRRRRVFIVCRAGGDHQQAIRALCESCDGHPPTRDCTWQGVASRPGARAVGTLQAAGGGRGWRVDAEGAAEGHLVVADTLTSGSHPASNAPGRRREDDVNLVTAFHQTQEPITEADMRPAIGRTSIGMGIQSANAGVRRLTPGECEKLMSWPEVLTLYGESDDHIRGSVQSCRAQASAAIRACDGLLGLWTFGREVGSAPPGHPEPARGSGRAVFSMPREAQPETCPTSGLRRVRFYLPTEAAKACALLLGPVHRGEQPSFGDPSLGVHASLNGWTAPEGVKAPDSRRYAACGDGVVSNVAEWIGRRIMALDGDAAEAVPLEHLASVDGRVVAGGGVAELVGEVE